MESLSPGKRGICAAVGCTRERNRGGRRDQGTGGRTGPEPAVESMDTDVPTRSARVPRTAARRTFIALPRERPWRGLGGTDERGERVHPERHVRQEGLA